MFVHLFYFALVAVPVFIIGAWSDFKTNRVDTRPFFFLIGLAYASFFANDKWIILAFSVSIALIAVQYSLRHFKIPPIGSGDFPVFQAYALIVMLFAAHLWIFIVFFILPLIIFLIWKFVLHHRGLVPSISFSFIVFLYLSWTII